MNQYSKYLNLKLTIESLFGTEAWYALKESNHLPTWKKQTTKVIKALLISIQQSVEVHDQDWMIQIIDAVDKGISSVNKANEIDETISILAATLIRISFLQTGLMPNRKGDRRSFSLKKDNWKFNLYRSAIYIQTKEQKEKFFWSKQQKEIGFERQIELFRIYKQGGSALAYEEWCAASKST